MPKEGLSIYFTIKDGASTVLSSIGDKTKALDKETQQLAQAYKALQAANTPLIQKQKDLKSAIENQRKAVADARKEFNKYGDDVTGLKLQLAVEEQDALKRALADVENQIKSNDKTLSGYKENIRKSASGSSSDTSLASVAKGLVIGQVGQMVASSLGGLGEAYLTSAIGTPEAALLSGTFSGAISGGAAGAVAGPWGALAGAVVGAISGAISGATQIYEEKDDAFKEYYAGLYETVNENTESMISSGSATAGSREQTHKAFAKRFGSEEAADEYLGQVEAMAARTNYGYDEITGYAQLLLNSYESDEVFSVLQSLSDATAGLNLSSSDVSVMISGLSRMRTTGKTTQEYLNYFSERGVDVYSALGEALGVDKSKIAGMVTKGDIGGEFAAQAILDYIDSQYGGLSEDLMSTYDAMTANLEDIMTTIDAAGGEGYNEMRKEGLAAETAAYSGPLGEAMEEINRIAGENKAYLENLSEQYTREALSAVLMGETTTVFSPEDQKKLEQMALEYEQAAAEQAAGSWEASLKMESLKEEAEALATAAYESSESYLAAHDAEMDQIDAIRANTKALEATTLAYEKSQNLSKGQASATVSGETGTLGTFLSGEHEYFEDPMYSSAYGMHRVPYNEFPALLHEDERVLTASEARALDAAGQGAGLQIVITGNSFAGTGEEMADQLAEILVRKLEAAAVIAVPR